MYLRDLNSTVKQIHFGLTSTERNRLPMQTVFQFWPKQRPFASIFLPDLGQKTKGWTSKWPKWSKEPTSRPVVSKFVPSSGWPLNCTPLGPKSWRSWRCWHDPVGSPWFTVITKVAFPEGVDGVAWCSSTWKFASLCWRQASSGIISQLVIRTIQALCQRSFVFPVCKGSDPTMRFATVNGFTNEAWPMRHELICLRRRGGSQSQKYVCMDVHGLKIPDRSNLYHWVVWHQVGGHCKISMSSWASTEDWPSSIVSHSKAPNRTRARRHRWHRQGMSWSQLFLSRSQGSYYEYEMCKIL